MFFDCTAAQQNILEQDAWSSAGAARALQQLGQLGIIRPKGSKIWTNNLSESIL